MAQMKYIIQGEIGDNYLFAYTHFEIGSDEKKAQAYSSEKIAEHVCKEIREQFPTINWEVAEK